MTIRDLNDITSFKWATVAQTYPSLRILLDGDSAVLAMTPDSLVDPRKLSIGSRVRVELSLRKCVIHGVSNNGFSGYPQLFDLRPSLASTGKGVLYNDFYPADTNTYAPLHGWRLVSGECFVSGLLKVNGTWGADTIFTLPREMWPLTNKIFFTSYANAVQRIFVNTDGTVKVSGGQTAGQYASLDGIHWNNSPTLARTAMTLAGAWTNYGAPYGNAAYVPDDGYGRRFYEGVIKGGAPGANIAVLASNPLLVPAAGTGKSRLMAQPDANGYSRMDILPGGAALNRSGNPAATNPSTQFSIDAAVTTEPYYALATDVSFLNGGNYDTTNWTSARVVRMGDGAIKMMGLAAATAGGSWLRIPTSMAPKHFLIFFVEGSDGIARIDVSPTGVINFVSGIGTFLSLEALQWMPSEAWDRALAYMK